MAVKTSQTVDGTQVTHNGTVVGHLEKVVTADRRTGGVLVWVWGMSIPWYCGDDQYIFQDHYLPGEDVGEPDPNHDPECFFCQYVNTKLEGMKDASNGEDH